MLLYTPGRPPPPAAEPRSCKGSKHARKGKDGGSCVIDCLPGKRDLEGGDINGVIYISHVTLLTRMAFDLLRRPG